MSSRRGTARFTALLGSRSARDQRLLAIGLGVVTLAAVLWLVALLRAPGDSGSLDARANAVGETVRCAACPQPISVNDEQNSVAQDERQLIRQLLQQGLSEEQVRQALVARYGPSILLAPPQQGFDWLIWLVPPVAIAACAAAVFLAARRWASGSHTPEFFGANAIGPPAPSDRAVAQASGAATTATPTAANPDLRRYEAMLDRELAGWD